jgi:serine/threonine protein kinase
MKLSFRQEWELGTQIDGGGFGQVYEAKGQDGVPAVVKFVPKAPGAERELLFADLSNTRNIIPIIDHGETAGHWALVMPRAEKSLRQYLQEKNQPLSIPASVMVLSDIAKALTDLDGRVVHRDLKPENVLLLNGRWCLADFGISRYAEATTAPDTRKYAMTPPYTAPERWRSERATSAADVYSLGVISYELLTGSWPFKGPGLEDFREQHLHEDPPPLDGIPALLAALIDECLYKAPEARPSPANVTARLTRAAQAPLSTGLVKLQEANRDAAARQAIATRVASQQLSESERLKALSDAAHRALKQISAALEATIQEAAPLADFTSPTKRADFASSSEIGWTVQLGYAALIFSSPSNIPKQPWYDDPGGWVRGQAPAFSVISYADLALKIHPWPGHAWHGDTRRSHSLWYCDVQERGNYQWFEVAFSFYPGPDWSGPLAFKPDRHAAQALQWPEGFGRKVVWPFTPITPGDLDDFIDRWAGWFADAAWASSADNSDPTPRLQGERSGHSADRRRRRRGRG